MPITVCIRELSYGASRRDVSLCGEPRKYPGIMEWPRNGASANAEVRRRNGVACPVCWKEAGFRLPRKAS